MLPDQAPSGDAQSRRMEYWRALCALGKLCVQPILFETLVIRLTAKLELLSSLSVSEEILPGGKPTGEEYERSAAYAHALLLTLSNALSAKVTKAQPDPDIPKYVDQLLPHLFRLFLGAAVTSERRIFGDQRLLHVGARIVKFVVEALSVEYVAHPFADSHVHDLYRQQQGFIEAMEAAFLKSQVKAVTGGEFSPIAVEFRPAHVCIAFHQFRESN